MLHLKGHAENNTSDCVFEYFPSKYAETKPFYNVKLINIYASLVPRELPPENHYLNLRLKADFRALVSSHKINKPFQSTVKQMRTILKAGHTLLQKRLSMLFKFPAIEYDSDEHRFSLSLPPKCSLYANNKWFFRSLGFAEDDIESIGDTKWHISNDSADETLFLLAAEVRTLDTRIVDWIEFAGDTPEEIETEREQFAATPNVVFAFYVNGVAESLANVQVPDSHDLGLVTELLWEGFDILCPLVNLKRSEIVAVTKEEEQLVIKFSLFDKIPILLTFSMDHDSQSILKLSGFEWTFSMDAEHEDNKAKTKSLVLKSQEFEPPPPYLLENKMQKYYPFLILVNGHQSNSFITGKGSVCSLAFVDDDRILSANKIALSTKGGSLNLTFLTPDFKDITFTGDLEVFLHLKICL